jgi:uncharacterized DUF497 family protein
MPTRPDPNLRKHGIDFADAVGVFEDEWAFALEQQEVAGESRSVILGMDFLGRIVVVVSTYRGDDIRLISARPATPRERTHYEQGRI